MYPTRGLPEKSATMESPGIYGSFQLQPWVLKAVGAPGIEVSDFCSSESFGLYFCKACGVGPFHVPRNWNMSDHEWLKMQGTSHGQKQVDTRWGWVNTCQYLEYVSIIIYHQDEYPFTFHLHSIYHPFTSHFFPRTWPVWRCTSMAGSTGKFAKNRSRSSEPSEPDPVACLGRLSFEA